MRLSYFLLLSFLLASCSSNNSADPDVTPEKPNEVSASYTDAFPNLSFDRPLNIQHAGDQSNRLFVEEQGGSIYVFENNSEANEKNVFLDVSNKISASPNERGLLGLEFHPDYETNGFFYVNYTEDGTGDTVISRFKVSDQNPDQADPNSELILMTVNQPYGNHNGGHLAFGPDGYLYIALGDGGDGGDPDNNGQNLKNLLGSILRIDVDNPQEEKNYGIPADNPFVGNSEGYEEEIFAYGLRNPWRFSFDSETSDLWAGDVGQEDWEYIHIIEKGLNYGWNIIEGSNCYQSTNCDKSGLELPVFEYSHDNGDRSITGGYVYHGSEVEDLEGLYIYADYISGRTWALNPETFVNTELFQAEVNISSFGTDQNNELYFCGFDGNIYRFTEAN